MPARKPIMAKMPPAETLDFRALAALWQRGETGLFVILGPTASGKTRLAVRLAQALACPAEIISAESRQVYRGMDIGTGKDLSDYAGIPYHLIDILDAGQQYNVHDFTEDFRRVYADIRKRGAAPILCGGTGLYINAVLSGYDFAGKKPLSSAMASEDPSGLRPFVIGTRVSREERNARIDRRLDERLQEGMVEEIRGLLASGVSAEVLISYGLEYKFVTRYVLGELDYGQMREQLATAIHQFAKRQMTWFRGMERAGIVIHWVEN